VSVAGSGTHTGLRTCQARLSRRAGIEDDAAAQAVGFIKAEILDACALLQGLETLPADPPRFVAADIFRCTLEVGGRFAESDGPDSGLPPFGDLENPLTGIAVTGRVPRLRPGASASRGRRHVF